MGLGGTAKKLQKVVDVADELYAKINDLREELSTVRDRIDSTNDRVEGLEQELAEQRVLLERLAEANDVSTDLGSVDEQETAEETEEAVETVGTADSEAPEETEPAAESTDESVADSSTSAGESVR